MIYLIYCLIFLPSVTSTAALLSASLDVKLGLLSCASSFNFVTSDGDKWRESVVSDSGGLALRSAKMTSL